MKPARTGGSALSLSTRIFSLICRPASTQPSRCDGVTEKVKAFATGANAFLNRLGALTHQAALHRSFTVCSPPLAAQAYSLQSGHSLSVGPQQVPQFASVAARQLLATPQL